MKNKEQTPIEQKLKSIISVELMDLSIMDEVVEHKTDEIYKGVMAIINAKVLEALEREQEDLDFIYSLLPKWTKEVPKGYGGMFYGTLSYEGDLKVKERVDKILQNRSKTKV
jgi:hypothetical protein